MAAARTAARRQFPMAPFSSFPRLDDSSRQRRTAAVGGGLACGDQARSRGMGCRGRARGGSRQAGRWRCRVSVCTFVVVACVRIKRKTRRGAKPGSSESSEKCSGIAIFLFIFNIYNRVDHHFFDHSDHLIDPPMPATVSTHRGVNRLQALKQKNEITRKKA